MARFIINGSDGVATKQHPNPTDSCHDIAISALGAVSGTLTIEGKKIGSDIYETIPDGVIDMSIKNSIQFTGSIESYQFTLVDFVGAGSITITDTSGRAGQ